MQPLWRGGLRVYGKERNLEKKIHIAHTHSDHEFWKPGERQCVTKRPYHKKIERTHPHTHTRTHTHTQTNELWGYPVSGRPAEGGPCPGPIHEINKKTSQ